MTLHQALRVIDHTLTPGTTKFSDYVLETSDDNLFLRTCFCKKDWQLEDSVRVGRKRPNSVGRKRPIVAA